MSSSLTPSSSDQTPSPLVSPTASTEPDVVMQLLAGQDPENTGKRKRKGLLAPRWTSAEEDRLRMLVGELGERKWSAIAERLESSRSAMAVEQHWQIMVGRRKKVSKASKASPSSLGGEGASAPP